MTTKFATAVCVFVACVTFASVCIAAEKVSPVADASLTLNAAYVRCATAQQDTTLSKEAEQAIIDCCGCTTDVLKFVVNAMEHNTPVTDDIQEIAMDMARATVRCIRLATETSDWTQPPRDLTMTTMILKAGKMLAMEPPSDNAADDDDELEL